MNKKLGLIFTILALCSAVISGCGLLGAPEPLKIVVLSRYESKTPLCAAPLPVQILIPAPYASAGLNTERIAILMDDRQVSYLEGYKWDDSNSNLAQRALLDAINGSGCFRGAGTGSMALRADYRLETDLKLMHFVDVAGQKPLAAEVSLVLRLIEVNSGVMIAQCDAQAREDSKNGDLFKSMEGAMRGVVQISLDWLRKSVQSDLARKIETAQTPK